MVVLDVVVVVDKIESSHDHFFQITSGRANAYHRCLINGYLMSGPYAQRKTR